MTSDAIARGYLARAIARVEALQMFFDDQCWADVVREAQEAVELLLKAAMRHVRTKPARTSDRPPGAFVAR